MFIILIIVCIIRNTVNYLIYILKKRKRPNIKPVVCVCVVNNKVGVCLREDYNRASENWWKRWGDMGPANLSNFGCRIPVEDSYTFPIDSKELAEFLEGCRVEEVVFRIKNEKQLPISFLENRVVDSIKLFKQYI
jgi:hypothetical protein